MSDEQHRLGDFLRARRDLVDPERAGVPLVGVRRVRGLRRAEVAMLAGISVEYYLRLEQGRDRNPSPQVLRALARVLELDDDATAYLLDLAAERPRRARRRPAETVPKTMRTLLETLPYPAFVEGRLLDVLAATSLATALSPRLTRGHNRLRDFFLDPAERDLYPQWEAAAAGLVAGFRQAVGTDTDDPHCVELVGELSLASPLFRRLWARHDVRERRGASLTFHHPQVGDLTVHREKLAISGTNGMMLVLYHPDPATDAAEKLTLLAAASTEAAPRNA